MTISLSIDGKLSKHEAIYCEIEVPLNWKPSFEEFCKVKGTLRMMTEKLAQEHEPRPEQN